MNATEKLKAKQARRRPAPKEKAAEIIDKNTTKKRKMPQTIRKGQAPQDLLNPKELAVLEFLLTQPDYTAHLNDMSECFPTAGVYQDTISTRDKNKKGVNEGNEKNYRWAQNSCRKLLRKHIIVREGQGTYRAWPRKSQRFITATRLWMAETAVDRTPSALQERLAASGDYPSKAALARAVKIPAKRWARVLGGAPLKEGEQDLINEAWASSA